jgi:hypothetical protein
VPSKPKASDPRKPKPLPGEPLTCELCGQDPESIAFDPDQCGSECPFRRSPSDRTAMTLGSPLVSPEFPGCDGAGRSVSAQD